MSELLEILKLLVPFLVGGGIVAIWTNWKIEKEREKNKSRRDLIANWRKSFLENPLEDGSTDIRSNPAYLQIRPFLSERAKKLFDRKSMIVDGKIMQMLPVMQIEGGDYPLELMSDEIARIERGWDLI